MGGASGGTTTYVEETVIGATPATVPRHDVLALVAAAACENNKGRRRRNETIPENLMDAGVFRGTRNTVGQSPKVFTTKMRQRVECTASGTGTGKNERTASGISSAETPRESVST